MSSLQDEEECQLFFPILIQMSSYLSSHGVSSPGPVDGPWRETMVGGLVGLFPVAAACSRSCVSLKLLAKQSEAESGKS